MVGIEGNLLGVWGKFYPRFIIRRFYQIVELKRHNQNKTDTKHFLKWKHHSEKYISEGLGLEILGHQASRPWSWGSSTKQNGLCGWVAELWVEDFSFLRWRRRSCRDDLQISAPAKKWNRKKTFKEHQQVCNMNFCLNTHHHIPEGKGSV